LKQLGRNWVDLHAWFRHTFATDLVLKGMNPYHVMILTRHKSVQSFRRYTKAADQAAAEAAFMKLSEGRSWQLHSTTITTMMINRPREEPLVVQKSLERLAIAGVSNKTEIA